MSGNKTLLVASAVVILVAGLAIGYFAGRERAARELLVSLGPGTRPDSACKSVAAGTGGTSGGYACDSLELYDITAHYVDDIMDGKVPAVFGKIRNKGSKTLYRVDITAYFQDSAGNTVHECEYPAVLVGALMNADPPLRPGYIREFGFKAKGCPSEWSQGKAEVAITNVSFN
jgi:hypothetical protein